MLARMARTSRRNPIAALEAGEADALAMEHEVEMLQERIAELEFAAEDSGWERIDESGTDIDVSREMLRRIIRDSQVMYLKNPLVDHAVGVISYYVFGQGVQITGKGAANDRVQEFLADRGNHRVLTSQQALIGNDAQLTYEGNVFFALFGAGAEVTKVRRIPTLQMVAGDIVRNPEDDAEVWLYLRRWKRKALDETGRVTTQDRVDYYPDVWFDPTTSDALKGKPKEWGEGTDRGEVHWDSPVIHIKDGGLNGAKFGVPITYSSLDWARAVSRDLSDYATIRRALARFAWKVIAKNKAVASAAARKLSSTVTTQNAVDRNPPPTTASTFIGTEGNDLQPLRTAGAAPSPEEGRRLWLMVAAGTGIPETILSGNAEVGNLATAKTLDRPTELMMKTRQSLWADLLSDVIEYDLMRAQAAGTVPSVEPDPNAPPPDEGTDALTGITVAPATVEVDLTPTIDFPDILEDDVTARVQAIVQAATLGASGTPANTMPDDLLTRLLLTALGVDDVDEIVAEMFPPEAPTLPEPPADEPPTAPDPLLGSPDGTLLAIPAEARFAHALDAFAEELAGGRIPRQDRARRRARKPSPPTPAAAG